MEEDYRKRLNALEFKLNLILANQKRIATVVSSIIGEKKVLKDDLEELERICVDY